ncbi:MAG TPA: methylated-DNA--[protein]-cysteine S-methyltransferase [Phenylobacterium sp.]|nr:methylated-DNA--[protein]-cysteine S-methyltransferase [Phenylobacterium sp.]
MTQGFHIFETVLGWAGLAWGDRGLIGAHLPERELAGVRARMQKRFPQAVETDAPPPSVAAALAEIRRLLAGEKPMLADILIDEARVPEFNRRVYQIARSIPPGETLTYGEIAVKLGDRLLARDVGQALGANPWPIVVPCHRVTAAGGKLGGFSAPGGRQTKLRLLAIEGARAAAQGDLFG